MNGLNSYTCKCVGSYSGVNCDQREFEHCTPRVVHGSDLPAGRVGLGYDFSGFWRVGSAPLWVFYSGVARARRPLDRGGGGGAGLKGPARKK